MKDLPEGWIRTTLSKIATVNMGQSPAGEFTNEEGIGMPLIGGAADYEDGKIKPARYTSEPIKVCETGDLILSIRATIGKVAIADRAYCLGRGVVGIKSHVDPHWLYYTLLENTKRFEEAGSGSTFKQISKQIIEEWPIVVPPHPEQQKIARRLEFLLSKSKQTRSNLEMVSVFLDRYKYALLNSAFVGDLTRQWRLNRKEELPTSENIAMNIKADKLAFYNNQISAYTDKIKKGIKGLKPKEPSLPGAANLEQQAQIWDVPSNWSWQQIGDFSFVTKLAGFEYTKFVEYDRKGDLKVIKAENAGPNGFRKTDYSRIHSNTVRNLERSMLRGGELLVVFVGAGVGQVALVPENEKFFLGPNIALVRPYSGHILTRYLELFLRSDKGRNMLLLTAKAVAQPSLSMASIRSTPIALPPLEEQNEIIRQLDEALSRIGNISKLCTKSIKFLTKLDTAFLEKGNIGKLVSQSESNPDANNYLETLEHLKSAYSQGHNIPKPKKQINSHLLVKTLREVLKDHKYFISAQDAFRLCGIGPNSTTEEIELIYAELRALEEAGNLAVDVVRDDLGRKLYDKIKYQTL